jgi:hypothetical protein
VEHLAPNFGLLIAYVLPGLVTLAGIAPQWPLLRHWLRGDHPGGVILVLVASLGAGMIVSGLRWMTVDRLFAHCGLPRPTYDYAAVMQPEHAPAFQRARDSFYRHYQFYANTAVALIAAFVGWSVHAGSVSACWGAMVVGLILALGFCAYDCLSKNDQVIADIMRRVRKDAADGK